MAPLKISKTAVNKAKQKAQQILKENVHRGRDVGVNCTVFFLTILALLCLLAANSTCNYVYIENADKSDYKGIFTYMDSNSQCVFYGPLELIKADLYGKIVRVIAAKSAGIGSILILGYLISFCRTFSEYFWNFFAKAVVFNSLLMVCVSALMVMSDIGCDADVSMTSCRPGIGIFMTLFSAILYIWCAVSVKHAVHKSVVDDNEECAILMKEFRENEDENDEEKGKYDDTEEFGVDEDDEYTAILPRAYGGAPFKKRVTDGSDAESTLLLVDSSSSDESSGDEEHAQASATFGYEQLTRPTAYYDREESIPVVEESNFSDEENSVDVHVKDELDDLDQMLNEIETSLNSDVDHYLDSDQLNFARACK